MSRPYATEQIVVGVPPMMPRLNDIRGRQVAVAQGSAVAHLLTKKGAVPVTVARLGEGTPPPSGLPVAAARGQLSQWGLIPTSVELAQEEHVFAVPPGENRWLMEWERFLHPHAARVPPMLAQEAGV